MVVVGIVVLFDMYLFDFGFVIGQIRVLILDVEQVDYFDSGILEYMFLDVYLRGLYVIVMGEGMVKVYCVVVLVLCVFVVFEGLIQKVIWMEDFQIDGVKLVGVFFLVVKQFEDQVNVVDEDLEIMMIVDFQFFFQDGFFLLLYGFLMEWMVGVGSIIVGCWL